MHTDKKDIEAKIKYRKQQEQQDAPEDADEKYSVTRIENEKFGDEGK